MDNSDIKRLLELVEKYDLEELEITEGDCSVSVRGAAPAGRQAPAPEEVFREAVTEDAPEEAPRYNDDSLYKVTAPLVGVYYDAPAPDQPKFVSVGDRVEVGTELCLIEAMKVFSPIPSEVTGTVVSIDVKNAELVSEGQVIMRIRLEEQ
ncbi:MAG: acetyl-CoA carboxylase, biotin carboxyl carrier protein [Abditibacteriota bacterium]|nr:acetyl-CoA carboxylase, biotin carboxyl carrier protein [Abditibacteriota bacterium]